MGRVGQGLLKEREVRGWRRGWRVAAVVVFAAAALGVSGCGDDQDPDGAKALWDKIHQEHYRSWKRAPGWETRRETSAPHSDAVEIFLNPTMADAVAAGATTWPLGSLIAKDGYSGSEHEIVAVMEKREGGWYWAEYPADGGGEADYSGSPATCTDCHQAGRDFVMFFSAQ